MRRITAIIFLGTAGWMANGALWKVMLWPNDPCTHYPSMILAYLMGSTNFSTYLGADLFWGLVKITAFVSGLFLILNRKQQSPT